MQLVGPEKQDSCNEYVVITRMLPLADANILELGCGNADITRLIAEKHPIKSIVAAEVDQQQHDKNLLIDDLPRVSFESFGAESIPYPDDHFDIVLMFKSLHHVPLDLLDNALNEITRVLRPGGLAYISEPVFDGDFNDIMRLFHDEETVRKSAFDAMVSAVAEDLFLLKEEYFFMTPVKFKSFSQYEKGIMNVTHTDFSLTSEVIEEVKARFERHRSDEGYSFEYPNRVDLLQKPLNP